MGTLFEEKSETILVVLPDEVKELALRVPESKQKEVQTVLTQIFAGTADWKKQADLIVVKNINDIMSMQLADTGRKNVKNARLAAEKIFDAKRDEVQQKKSEFDLEDKLWLKAKQTAQILFRDIETTFEWKARFRERFEAEQKELTTQLRIEKVDRFTNDINHIALENMSDQIFDMFLSGIEKEYNDRIIAERKAEEDRLAKEKAEAEERQRLENIRLKKEAEEREKQAGIERKEQAAALAYQKQEAEKERNELLEKARVGQEKRDKELAAEKARADAERVKRVNLELEIQRQKVAREAEKKKAKLAPDKDKLLNFMQAITDLPRPEVKSIEAANIATNANTILIKVATYILENANKL
jgi:hypothetical protein